MRSCHNSEQTKNCFVNNSPLYRAEDVFLHVRALAHRVWQDGRVRTRRQHGCGGAQPAGPWCEQSGNRGQRRRGACARVIVNKEYDQSSGYGQQNLGGESFELLAASWQKWEVCLHQVHTHTSSRVQVPPSSLLSLALDEDIRQAIY